MLIVRETQLRRQTARMKLDILELFIFIVLERYKLQGRRDLARGDLEVARETIVNELQGKSQLLL